MPQGAKQLRLAYSSGSTTTYAYDPTSRVTNIVHEGPNGLIETLTYGYDAVGNPVSVVRANHATTLLPQEVQAAYNAANEQIRFNSDVPNLTYDANGNLSSRPDTSGTTMYVWNARNRLVGITGPSVSSRFAYDALGRRIHKTINDLSTEYVYDGNDIVAEFRGSSLSASYLRHLSIDQPFVRLSDTAEFYHHDALGSTVALTNAVGATQAAYTYEPFGASSNTGASENALQYTGRERDEGDLYYYRARYYSTALQRFLSPDPIDSGHVQLLRQYSDTRALGLSIQSLNYLDTRRMHPFLYASANPVLFRDPLGLFTVICGVGGAAAAGTAVEASAGVLVNPGLFGEKVDAGGFFSVGAGGGLNISGDGFCGYVAGGSENVAGTTFNENYTFGPISYTIMHDLKTDEIVGATVGYGPSVLPVGAHWTRSWTDTWTFRDGVRRSDQGGGRK